MRYIVSDATSAGEATIRIFFEPGTDPNINVVNVQNRVNIMTSRLPELVVREGILVSQVVPSMLMYLNLYSKDPNTDQKDLFNYANVYIMPVLKRIKGMGIPVNLGNRTFAMRIWLNPERMRAYNVSVEDVMEALATQSIIGSPGRLGQATGMTSQSKEYVLTYIGRYNEPEQYANIVLKALPDGEILRLKDVCVPPLVNDSKGEKRRRKREACRSRKCRAWLGVLRHLFRRQRPSRRIHRLETGARLQRRRRDRGSEKDAGGVEGVVSSRDGLRDCVRRIPVR